MKRKVCVVTGSRADYGLLYWLLKELKEDRDIQLQLVVAGMHLSKRYGLTYKAIVHDGFSITKKIPMLRYADSTQGVIQSIGLGSSLFAKAFEQLNPEVVVLLGDRYEIFSSAIAAYLMRIPIAHIHGGETTQGAFDEGFRHSITKMACVHFATAAEHRQRIIQLGEQPKSVFNYGAPGLDTLRNIKYVGKNELSQRLNFDLEGKVALITYHPVTLEGRPITEQVKNIFVALKSFSFKGVFTKANGDPSGVVINQMVHKFCRQSPRQYKLVENLGQHLYFNCLKNFDLVIGNSSSGLIEAPSFKIPVVNVGNRQDGRIKAANVIDTDYSAASIKRGIDKALSRSFNRSLKGMRNPYLRFSDGKASLRIKEKIKQIHWSQELIKKKFYDVPG